jgi:hypothetical protein
MLGGGLMEPTQETSTISTISTGGGEKTRERPPPAGFHPRGLPRLHSLRDRLNSAFMRVLCAAASARGWTWISHGAFKGFALWRGGSHEPVQPLLGSFANHGDALEGTLCICIRVVLCSPAPSRSFQLATMLDVCRPCCPCQPWRTGLVFVSVFIMNAIK